MLPAAVILHETLIRLAKGAITAWEKWLESQKKS
jgi:hypothetical protein